MKYVPANSLFSSPALPALPVTQISDLCIILDFDISIWVLILRLCLNLAKSFWPPYITDWFVYPHGYNFSSGFYLASQRLRELFLQLYKCRWPKHSCTSHGCPRSAWTVSSSITSRLSCLSSLGRLLVARCGLSTLLGFHLFPWIGNSTAPVLFNLLLCHSSYWTGALIKICNLSKLSTVLFLNKITLCYDVTKKKIIKKHLLDFTFLLIKTACLLSFYRKYFKHSFWRKPSAWVKMLRT